MSIRTNPMKAIPLLLKRLKTTRTRIIMEEDKSSLYEKLEKLNSKLTQIKNLFSSVRKNEEELLDILTEADGHLRNYNIDENKNKLDQVMEDICQRINNSIQKLLPADASQGEIEAVNSSRETSQDDKRGRVHSSPSSSQPKNDLVDENLEISYVELEDDQLKNCLLSLSVFPEDVVIKKRHTIYWWIGEGLITETKEKTAEEVGEYVIDELLKCNMILPHGKGICPVVKKFKINPHIRPKLMSSVSKNLQEPLGFSFQIQSYKKQHACLVLEQNKVKLGDKGDLKPDHWTTVFNLGASYLNFESQLLAKMKNLVVLQLGRWQDLASHHIEVGNEDFLNDLRNQRKTLKYLSLRGISRISMLPPSIAQLESLEILDLKACHNLEILPNDIASLKSLTHLDVSQCYLLEGMPKGIEKLTQLQVLKGFVIGSSRKTPCRISDLANLKKLKRLSIHIGSEAVIQDREFERLEELSEVKCLKISWGVSGPRYSDIQIIFPQKLEKLDLEGFPGEIIPEWLKPSKLPGALKKLYIKGGKLKSLDHGEICHKWRVDILRLVYLKDLQIEDRKLQKLFPSLRYVEKQKVSNLVDDEWSIEE